MEKQINRRSEAGFTLVELAIVMIIIGLLIGGILKGQELIANAQVTATVAQIKGLEAATSTFRDAYNAFPGDIQTPATRLPNCTAAPCNVASATAGNGRVDGVPGAIVAAATEPLMFFTHLAAGDLLTGVQVNPTGAPISWGDELPEAEVGGAGFSVGFAATAAGATNVIGTGAWDSSHFLALQLTPTAAVAAGAGGGAISPGTAARIDRKLDDGAPNTGIVRAAGSLGATGCASLATVAGVYVESQQTNECSLYIRIQG